MESLPTRERGLKHLTYPTIGKIKESLPTRERGLKQLWYPRSEPASLTSLPTRERGLKQVPRVQGHRVFWSLRARVSISA